jgi:hypothetical protein
MAVQTEINRISYMGNNSLSTPYPVPFKFFDNSDLQVSTLTQSGVVSLLLLGVDYTVTGAGNDGGGNIFTASPVVATTVLTIARDLPATQLFQFEEADRFPARSFEDALDKVTMLAQQQRRDVTDSFRAIPVQGPIAPVQLQPNALIGTQPTSNQLRTFTGAQLQTLLNLPQTVVDQPTKTFTDATERGLAVPDFLGQVGVQLDTNNVYVGQTLVAGGWVQYAVLGAMDINGLTSESNVDPNADEIAFFDASAGANRKTSFGNLVPDGSISTGKIADGALPADSTGRAKMADGFLTTAKIADDAVTDDKLSLSANAGEIKKALNADNAPPIFACRAWVNFDGTTTPPTIRASGNVSSVGRVSTGIYTVNFTEPMPDKNFVVVSEGVRDNSYLEDRDYRAGISGFDHFSTTSTGVYFCVTTGTPGTLNSPLMCVSVFR